MGYIMMLLFYIFVAQAAPKTSIVPLATFDGVEATTYDWEVVNDPVMGGKSHSTFQVDKEHEIGLWGGAVEIVPSLDAPGFCNLQAPGYGQKSTFKDITGASGIVVTAAQTNA